MSWLHCQNIAGLDYWVQLLFNFTPVSVCQVYTGPKPSQLSAFDEGPGSV